MNSTGKNSMFSSYQTITNELGNVVEKLSFGSCLPVRNEMEAGGRRRNPTDWTYNNVPTSYIFDRGYTGHQQMDVYDLINMNGRLYDPRLGRMLSPDPFVQNTENSQNFNRYSYALNNPLKYTDPSGEIWIVDDAVLGVIGGGINVLSNLGNIHNFGQGLAYFGVGFVSGAVSTYISPIGSAALMGAGNAALASYYSTGTIDAGAVAQGAITSAAFATVTMGLGSIAGPYVSNITSSITNSPVLQEAITQGAMGTIGGAIGGGTMSAMNGGDFWEGAGQGALWGGGIGFATGAFAGYGYAKQRGLDPWTGKELHPITPMPSKGIDYFNSNYDDLSELRIPNKLYHYTYDDPYNWNELGIKGKTLHLTPDGELNRLTATYDLDLPRVPRYRIEISTSDPNYNLSNIQIIRQVNSNVYGHGGGGWEILYNGVYKPSGTYKLTVTKIW